MYSLLSYAERGSSRAGVSVGERVFDAAEFTATPAYTNVLAILGDWETSDRILSAAANKVTGGANQAAGLLPDKVQLLAPVLYPGSIFCAGANYKDHIAEMARVTNKPLSPNAKEAGELPWHFVKTSRSAVVGHEAQIKLPSYSAALDWEVELAAVIGKKAKDVPAQHALDHVAGYTIANDLSIREVGRKHTPVGSPFHYDWISMKCFDGSCPLGPWIVPASQIPDPQELGLKLWVNGEPMQDSHTSQMIFSVAEQIAMLSSRLTLNPGDVVLTGTPAGVGFARGTFLKSGDVVRLWIERIGEMSHSVL